MRKKGSLSQLVEAAAAQLGGGLSLDSATLATFEAHAELIARWSGRVRLVGDHSPEALAIRHFVDSLTICLAVEPREGMLALDVGSGAGFPGLVLAAVWPEVRWQLLEVDRRKAAFLNAAVASLGLAGRVRVLNVAAEGDPEEEGVEPVDLILSRAVRGPERLLSWLAPYGRPGARIVGMLGPAYSEAEALREQEAEAGYGRVASWAGSLPGEEGDRTVVVWGPIVPRGTSSN